MCGFAYWTPHKRRQLISSAYFTPTGSSELRYGVSQGLDKAKPSKNHSQLLISSVNFSFKWCILWSADTMACKGIHEIIPVCLPVFIKVRQSPMQRRSETVLWPQWDLRRMVDYRVPHVLTDRTTALMSHIRLLLVPPYNFIFIHVSLFPIV